MSDQPRYARVLYSYIDAYGDTAIITVRGELAYFPSTPQKPAPNAADDVLTTFFNQHLGHGRSTKEGAYVESVTRREAENGITYFDVRLTGLGAHAVQNEYGVKPYRPYPIYIIYTLNKDPEGEMLHYLCPDLGAALNASGIRP